jgi:SOS response regulatory protein OraA/RecX
MAALERVNTMKQQGMSESQIMTALTNEGVSPREINDALSQSRIKAAVASDGDMQPSIMPGETGQQYMSVPDSGTTPAPTQQVPQQNYATQPAYAAPQQTAQVYAPQQAQPVYQDPQAQPAYDPNAYAQQGYDPNAYAQPAYDPNAYAQQGYYPQALDIETVRDISKQQVEEALRKMREEIASISKLKTEIKFEMQDVENRLIKVEEVIHELQSAVIRKIGEYGESIASISKEVQATQQSFAKVINPLMDKRRGISSNQSSPEESEPSEVPEEKENRPKPRVRGNEKKTQGRNDNSGSFEDYFR